MHKEILGWHNRFFNHCCWIMPSCKYLGCLTQLGYFHCGAAKLIFECIVNIHFWVSTLLKHGYLTVLRNLYWFTFFSLSSKSFGTNGGKALLYKVGLFTMHKVICFFFNAEKYKTNVKKFLLTIALMSIKILYKWNIFIFEQKLAILLLGLY